MYTYLVDTLLLLLETNHSKTTHIKIITKKRKLKSRFSGVQVPKMTLYCKAESIIFLSNPH